MRSTPPTLAHPRSHAAPGPAGLVLADRLSATGKHTLVLEAGAASTHASGGREAPPWVKPQRSRSRASTSPPSLAPPPSPTSALTSPSPPPSTPASISWRRRGTGRGSRAGGGGIWWGGGGAGAGEGEDWGDGEAESRREGLVPAEFGVRRWWVWRRGGRLCSLAARLGRRRYCGRAGLGRGISWRLCALLGGADGGREAVDRPASCVRPPAARRSLSTQSSSLCRLPIPGGRRRLQLLGSLQDPVPADAER